MEKKTLVTIQHVDETCDRIAVDTAIVFGICIEKNNDGRTEVNSPVYVFGNRTPDDLFPKLISSIFTEFIVLSQENNKAVLIESLVKAEAKIHAKIEEILDALPAEERNAAIFGALNKKLAKIMGRE